MGVKADIAAEQYSRVPPSSAASASAASIAVAQPAPPIAAEAAPAGEAAAPAGAVRAAGLAPATATAAAVAGAPPPTTAAERLAMKAKLRMWAIASLKRYDEEGVFMSNILCPCPVTFHEHANSAHNLTRAP